MRGKVKTTGEILLCLIVLAAACLFVYQGDPPDIQPETTEEPVTVSVLPVLSGGDVAPEQLLSTLPKYTGEPFVEVNGSIPFFSNEDREEEPFEQFSDLDELGRCGAAFAMLSKEMMPAEERGEIGMIKPSGWHTVRYDDLIEDKYLYNRCHLIAYMLTGQNDNPLNLITGTRYFNIDGMLPFELRVGIYLRRTENHVLYRVTPVYHGNDLVASGVLMEAYSTEDAGEGICFNVFVYNVQPGIEIDYATGESQRAAK